MLLLGGMAAAAADRVLTHAAVWTGDPANPAATALVVDDGRLVYVGDDAGASAFAEGARVEDLGGAFVMPGFVDAHMHPLEGGLELAECVLSELPDAVAVLDQVRACAQAAPGRAWVVGSGWALPLFPDANPTAVALDAVTGDHPAFLLAADGHSAWLNTAGLARAGIRADTPDPPGGRVERGPDGAPTGTLRESAVDPVYEVLPAPSRRERREALLAAQALALASGVTGVLEANADRPALRAYRALARSGALRLRVSVALETDAALGAAQVARLERWRRRFDGHGLRVTTAKLFVDGVLEARTAAMLAPYLDTGTTVAPDWPAERLGATVDALLAAGFDVHLHTIGDAAVRTSLDAVAAAGPGARGRVALAHLEAVDPADVPRFASLGVYAVFQPLWAWPDEYVRDLTWPALSPEAGARLYPIGDVSRAGGQVAFGSDWSVSSLVPMEGIEVAVTRADPDGEDPAQLGPGQAVALEDALRAYTSGAARAAGLGPGTLTVGAPADFVVLSVDPFTVAPSALSEVTVSRTVWAGADVPR